MANTVEHGLEVKPCTDPELAPQPDPEKYYIEIEGPRDDAIGQRDLPSHSDTESYGPNKAFWTFATMAVIGLAIGLAIGLGVGLANQHKANTAT